MHLNTMMVELIKGMHLTKGEVSDFQEKLSDAYMSLAGDISASVGELAKLVELDTGFVFEDAFVMKMAEIQKSRDLLMELGRTIDDYYVS